MKLITTANAKTIKGEKYGWLTGILYLAPSVTARTGNDLCPHADAGCRASCLYTAGRGHFKCIQKSRRRKTRELFVDRKLFVKQLCSDIEALQRRAERETLRLSIRLNGTSDIPWHRAEFGDIPGLFPDVQFYDYSKDPRRVAAVHRDNYYLLFSRGIANDAVCKRNLAAGRNVAVVFSKDNMPEEYWDYPVVSGDDSDLRFLDPSPCVVGLTAKGRARKDTTGFVVKGD